MLNRESYALNSGTDYFPEETEYNPGDYVIITDKNHSHHGRAARIIGIQRDIFETEIAEGSPDFFDMSKNLHVVMVAGPYYTPRIEMIISTKKVKKLENR